MSNKKIIKEKISEIRKRLHMSQAGFGNALGVSREVVASWERGRTRVPGDIILAAEKLLKESNAVKSTSEYPDKYISKLESYIEALESIKKLNKEQIEALKNKVFDLEDTISKLEAKNKAYKQFIERMNQCKRDTDPDDFDPQSSPRTAIQNN